jgi:tetratricopeptide (TPR) repeat protein/uncharacterized caspase-like protein
MSRWVALLFLLQGLLGQERPEQPVGVILEVTGGRLLRASTELPLTARGGDLLFRGDTLLSESGSISFLYCPEKLALTLEAPAEVTVRENDFRLRSGLFSTRKTIENCLLPSVEHIPDSPQHYGASLRRSLQPSDEQETTLPSRIGTLTDEQRVELQRELQPIDRALAADPKDRSARVSRVALLEKYQLDAEAIAEYKLLAEDWPDAAWVKKRLFVHQNEARPSTLPQSVMRGGKVYALVVGISKYQRLPPGQWLEDAHQDARVFGDYLQSPRGGSLPSSDVVMLTDETATTAAIKNAFETFLRARAGANDTVVVFIAAHGVVEPGRRDAYIVTYDSDPEDLASTALPMADVQSLVREDLSRVGHVLVYVDVCRAGNIGAMKGGNPYRVVEQLAEADGDLFLFLASGPKEYSFEGPQYGGGHGAFSYFLLDALNGSADFNHDGVVTVGEIIEYVQEQVNAATNGRQHPRDLGSMERAVTLAEMRYPGIALSRFTSSTKPGVATQGLAGLRGAEVADEAEVRGTDAQASTQELDRAIAGGQILPDEPQGAFSALRVLRRQLPPEEYLVAENKLRVALEDAGQQVLLRYLSGDQIPQDRNDFLRGYAYYEAARLLTPESLFLESRSAFFNGRATLFAKDYRRATELLERTARIDTDGAYSYNALGIAYLERADYHSAIQAFRDAVRLAPHWAYPQHNLALAYTQLGDYSAAIRSYMQAIQVAPQYSYLPYNLGLLYQRLNRRRDAEAEFQRAIVLAPSSGEPYNALGYLHASYGHAELAERYYHQALQRSPDLLAARQNLAVLLAEQPARFEEARDLWRQNLDKSPDYLPSRLSLARALSRRGEIPDAIREIMEIVARKPDYVAARLSLAELHTKQGDTMAALAELHEAVKLQPDNPAIHEQIGDLEKSQGHIAEAATAYQAALKYADDGTARKRIQRKLR